MVSDNDVKSEQNLVDRRIDRRKDAKRKAMEKNHGNLLELYDKIFQQNNKKTQERDLHQKGSYENPSADGFFSASGSPTLQSGVELEPCASKQNQNEICSNVNDSEAENGIETSTKSFAQCQNGNTLPLMFHESERGLLLTETSSVKQSSCDPSHSIDCDPSTSTHNAPFNSDMQNNHGHNSQQSQHHCRHSVPSLSQIMKHNGVQCNYSLSLKRKATSVIKDSFHNAKRGNTINCYVDGIDHADNTSNAHNTANADDADNANNADDGGNECSDDRSGASDGRIGNTINDDMSIENGATCNGNHNQQVRNNEEDGGSDGECCGANSHASAPAIHGDDGDDEECCNEIDENDNGNGDDPGNANNDNNNTINDDDNDAYDDCAISGNGGVKLPHIHNLNQNMENALNDNNKKNGNNKENDNDSNGKNSTRNNEETKDDVKKNKISNDNGIERNDKKVHLEENVMGVPSEARLGPRYNTNVGKYSGNVNGSNSDSNSNNNHVYNDHSCMFNPEQQPLLEFQKRFISLQYFLSYCSTKSSSQFSTSLRSLSKKELHEQILKIEKRALQLALLEGREMKRVKKFSVLSSKPGENDNVKSNDYDTSDDIKK